MSTRDEYRATLLDDLSVFSPDTLNLATRYLPKTELRWPLFEILRDLAASPRTGELPFADRMHLIRRAAIEWLAGRCRESGPRDPWSVAGATRIGDGAALREAGETLRGTLATVAVLAQHGDDELLERARTLVEGLQARLPDDLQRLAQSTGAPDGHAALADALTRGLGRIAGALAAGAGATASEESRRLEDLLVAP